MDIKTDNVFLHAFPVLGKFLCFTFKMARIDVCLTRSDFCLLINEVLFQRRTESFATKSADYSKDALTFQAYPSPRVLHEHHICMKNPKGGFTLLQHVVKDKVLTCAAFGQNTLLMRMPVAQIANNSFSARHVTQAYLNGILDAAYEKPELTSQIVLFAHYSPQSQSVGLLRHTERVFQDMLETVKSFDIATPNAVRPTKEEFAAAMNARRLRGKEAKS